MRMKEYLATVVWQRGAQPFSDNRYSRAHAWTFDGGQSVAASSSPLSVPLPMSDPHGVDPEEALVAAVSSCHMLFFLSIAQQKGFIVDDYRDEAVGIMDKNNEGQTAITRVILRPAVVFSGTPPTGAQRDAIHHAAHEKCYIANSIKGDVVVEPA
jgi:organic hydroperoxide reductase OsmC/OhrA